MKRKYLFIAFGNIVGFIIIGNFWFRDGVDPIAMVVLIISGIVGFVGIYFITRNWFIDRNHNKKD